MKNLAYILAMYICFLNVLPAMQQLAAVSGEQTVMTCGEHCCMQKEAKGHCTSERSKDCCKHGICNPFMTCSLCFSFYVQPITQLKIFESVNTEIPVYGNSAVSTYLADSWHPPKKIV